MGGFLVSLPLSQLGKRLFPIFSRIIDEKIDVSIFHTENTENTEI